MSRKLRFVVFLFGDHEQFVFIYSKFEDTHSLENIIQGSEAFKAISAQKIISNYVVAQFRKEICYYQENKSHSLCI